VAREERDNLAGPASGNTFEGLVGKTPAHPWKETPNGGGLSIATAGNGRSYETLSLLEGKGSEPKKEKGSIGLRKGSNVRG